MIHEILPADVELAKGMINASHSDAEILASLAARGLEPAKAAQLVDDLRRGRAPNVQLPYRPDAVFRSPSHRAGSVPAQVSPPPSSAQPQPRRRKRRRSRIPWWFVIVALFFLCALGYALFQTGRELTHNSVQDSKHEVPPAFAK